MEHKKVTQALDDESWVEAMPEELLQFRLLNVWTLVDLPHGKKGHRQEEGIDYDEVFAPVARIEAIRLFLAFASFMGFTVYQMDVKSAFLYGTIEEEVYVNQPPGFVDPEFPTRVYKVEKALYGLHQAPRAWYETLSTYLMENGFRRGTIDKTLFIKKIKNDILLYSNGYTQALYCKILQADVDMSTYLVKRIFRYLKGQPTLGLWYPKDLPMDLIAYSDSDYAGASIDRNSTTVVVLWLQNQLLDYGYNFMKTKIHVDNESAICVVKNLVYHSKTKHIEIRHHFIRDSYENKLIKMDQDYTTTNVADLLTKAFDVTSLVVPLTKVGDEAIHKELGDRMERAATTASSLEGAGQW
ncbi:retrovirus-related pol polyprotein from transposon TNT 1-94 [Tanacetum coccineum]